MSMDGRISANIVLNCHGFHSSGKPLEQKFWTGDGWITGGWVVANREVGGK
jgi:hypothetical protein